MEKITHEEILVNLKLIQQKMMELPDSQESANAFIMLQNLMVKVEDTIYEAKKAAHNATTVDAPFDF